MGMKIKTKYSIGQKIYTIIGFEIFTGVIRNIYINENKKIEYSVSYNYLENTQNISMDSVKSVTYIVETKDLICKEEDARNILQETLEEIKTKYKTVENFINDPDFTVESRLNIIREIVREKNEKLDRLKFAKRVEIKPVELKPFIKTDFMEENVISNVIDKAIKKEMEKMDSQLIHSMYVGAKKQVMEDFGFELIEEKFTKYFQTNKKEGE
jgi:hypothetical protein